MDSVVDRAPRAARPDRSDPRAPACAVRRQHFLSRAEHARLFGGAAGAGGDGRADPLFAELQDGFTSFQWHVDTYTLPPSALLLARSQAVQNQCFRVGRATYGMQFHFEASGDVVHDWTRGNPERVNRIAPGWLETQAAEDRARFAADADEAGARIARAFVATIGERART